MPGFCISQSGQIDIPDSYSFGRIQKRKIIDNWNLVQDTLNRFLDDKVFGETDTGVYISEGVILNKVELLKKYKKNDMLTLIEFMYKRLGREFFSEFRGSFSGALYDKSLKQWIIYTNYVGDKLILYYKNNSNICVGSDIQYLLSYMKIKNADIVVNDKGVYDLLTFGFMEQNETAVSGVFRLLAGQYIIIDNSRNITVKFYNKFQHTQRLQGAEYTDLIIEFDKRFRKAITLEYDKDLEYGYEHLVDMSGGLDSRMNAWVSNELGYTCQTFITYSQSGYLDETIPVQLAGYLKKELIFKPLDNLQFMYDLNILTQMQSGLCLYEASTGANRMLNSINMNRFGLEHTGQLGDAILGTFSHNIKEYNSNTISGLYSTKLQTKLQSDYFNMFRDMEEYKLYVRGFNGALSSHFIRQNYTEVASPFLDKELIDFCWDIPINLRFNHEFYKNWIIKKYPHAANFVWEKIHGRINDPLITYKDIMRRGCNKLKSIFLNDVFTTKNHFGMNPHDYWLHNDNTFHNFVNSTYKNLIDKTKLPKQLKYDVQFLFENGCCLEKLQVLTVLEIEEIIERYNH